MKLLITSYLIIGLTLGSKAQQVQLVDSFQVKTFTKVIKDHLSSDSIGCEVLIAKKGNILYQKTFGNADIELSVPLKPNMVFEIGSISKQFCAVAILQLVEKGYLSLNDDIRKYLPNYPTGQYVITIENLLTHTSGITDDVKEFDENRLDFSKFSNSQMLDFFKDIPLKFEPGTQMSYTSVGYLLLGYIIESITGKSYADYIRNNFLKPLNMTSAYLVKEFSVIPNRVKGYERDLDGKIINSRPDYIQNDPAGGLKMTITDYYNWHNALFNYKIIKKEFLEKAISPFKLKDGTLSNYGYGFQIDNAFGVPIIHHGGRTFGYNTHEMYSPVEDVLVLVFNNQSMSDFTSLATILTHIAVGKKYNFNEVAVPERILNTYVGQYKWNELTDQHVNIYKQNDKLMFKDSYNSFASIIHFTSDSTFYIYDYGFMMINSFLKDKNGKISGFNVKGSGESFNAKKVE